MFRLSSGACDQVGALGIALLCRDSLTVQPGGPTAEAKPFTPAAGDPGSE